VPAFTVATVGWAAWTANVQPHADARGYGKSGGLPVAFLNTIDASADLALRSYLTPDEDAGGCPPAGGRRLR
jgi:hypothetical protein